MSVSALTFTSASRQQNIRLRVAITQRAASSARRGLTLRSWKSASCFRRKRFSAAKALREWVARKARRTKSNATRDSVRKQCAIARKINQADIDAQNRTLRNVTGTTFSSEGVSADDRDSNPRRLLKMRKLLILRYSECSRSISSSASLHLITPEGRTTVNRVFTPRHIWTAARWHPI